MNSTASLDRVGEWMALMTKTYSPRDLREACAMPREDAVWFMEHCADAWEARERILAQQIERNGRFVASEKALYDEVIALRQRLEAAEKALRMVAGSNDCVCANRYDHGPMCDCVGDVVRASLPPSESEP